MKRVLVGKMGKLTNFLPEIGELPHFSALSAINYRLRIKAALPDIAKIFKALDPTRHTLAPVGFLPCGENLRQGYIREASMKLDVFHEFATLRIVGLEN